MKTTKQSLQLTIWFKYIDKLTGFKEISIFQSRIIFKWHWHILAFTHGKNTNLLLLVTWNNFYNLIDYWIIEWIYYKKIVIRFQMTKKSLSITRSSYWILIKYFNNCLFPNQLVYSTAAYIERTRLEMVASVVVTLSSFWFTKQGSN